MRFVFTMGRLTIFDFTLFHIGELEEKPDVVVVHHYEDDEDKPESPDDNMFGR